MSTLLGTLRSLKRWDARRRSVPGEHLLALGLGARLLFAGGRGTLLGRALALTAGAALVTRALSGRDGVARLVHSAPKAGSAQEG